MNSTSFSLSQQPSSVSSFSNAANFLGTPSEFRGQGFSGRVPQQKYPDLALSLFDHDPKTQNLRASLIETATQPEVNEQDHNGNTALMWAVSADREDLVQMLVDQGADLNVQNFAGETALYLAASRGNSRVCNHLLVHGANVNIPSLEGATAMHIAAAGGHVETLLILAARGAHANAQDEEGDTPLHYAVREGQATAVEFMVRELKCDVDATNDDCETPYQLATVLGETAMSKFLKNYSQSIGESMEETSVHSVDMGRSMLGASAAVHV